MCQNFTEAEKEFLEDITNDLREPTTVAHLLDIIERLSLEAHIDPQKLSPKLRSELKVCLAAL